MRAFDFLGSVAVVNFPKDFKAGHRSVYPKLWNEGAKKKFAEKLLKEQRSIKTVLEKSGKIKGRLRKISTKYLAGEKTKEVLYKENGCVFRFNVDSTYFSPRLSNERKEIASKIKKGENVLVMFAGVAPFSIVIAKNSKAEKVFSNEINREANKYAKLNIELNKLKNKVELIPGDIKRVANTIGVYPRRARELLTKPRKILEKNFYKGQKIKNKMDVIVMPRPQLKDSFLEQAFMLSKKNTRIYYYDFCEANKIDLVVEKIKQEAKKFKKKIKILGIKNAGEIAPYKIRVRVDLKVI